MNQPTVFTHGRPVTTPFGLLGRDENALSFALGYTLAKCPELLQQFLRRVGISGLRREFLSSVVISLQRHDHDGITDIEINVPGKAFVVVEAKIGLSIPTLEQCLKYVSRFKKRTEGKRRLVALVASPATSFVESYGTASPELKPLLSVFNWTDLIPDCAGLLGGHPHTTEAGRWLRSFHQFLEQEYAMRAFTDEVWIVAASTKPLWPGGMSFYETHVDRRIYYRDDCHGKRPLYIALRFQNRVTHIQKVLNVKHEVRPVDLVPELKNVPEGWPSDPYTIWMLGEPTPLPKPIPTGDDKMRGRHVSCDLDILLSSASIHEAVERMKQRNGEAK